jgi:hypothetical protein
MRGCLKEHAKYHVVLLMEACTSSLPKVERGRLRQVSLSRLTAV